jgi:hypothetical protein
MWPEPPGLGPETPGLRCELLGAVNRSGGVGPSAVRAAWAAGPGAARHGIDRRHPVVGHVVCPPGPVPVAVLVPPGRVGVPPGCRCVHAPSSLLDPVRPARPSDLRRSGS